MIGISSKAKIGIIPRGSLCRVPMLFESFWDLISFRLDESALNMESELTLAASADRKNLPLSLPCQFDQLAVS